jgi:class 3 adenylate cyclase
VRPGGDGWIARFDACLDAAASITFATRMNYIRHDGQFAYGAQLSMGLANLRARQLATRAVMIAAWDGRPARGDSGAAVDVGAWQALGLETRVIDPGPVDRDLARTAHAGPVVAGPPRVVRALIFTDYKGYSRLPETDIPVFNREVMGRIAKVLDAHDASVCCRNTWGDALYAVITDPSDAADIAIEIAETLKGVVIGDPGPDDSEGMRIGLHFGPVYQDMDPVTGRENFYGSEVTLTSRIEPTVVPGQIYTTQAFAAMLSVTRPDRYVSRYVGRVELAKGYGIEPIYQLERRAEG